MISFIHLAGCGHTGTSIIARVISEHSKILFIPVESGMYLANRYFDETSYVAEYTDMAENGGCEFILEKTPRHIWHVDYIRRRTLGSKFLLTTRDGREVIASLYERTQNWEASRNRYIDDSVLTLRQLEMGDCRLIKYEDFVRATPQVLISTYDWLGLDYEEKVLTFHERPVKWNLDNPYQLSGAPNLHDIKRNKQVNSKIKPLANKWQERVPEKYHGQMNELFSGKGVGRKIMETFGYKI